MWFKRKPRNRRLGRDQVLDVRLRSSQVRAARTRLAALTLGAVFGTVFGLYLLYRGWDWTLDRLVYKNPAFAIQRTDIETDGNIALDQLRHWAGIRMGENLLALDLARVKRDLEMVPLIQLVSVERILPHTVCIRITERKPVAQVNLPGARPGEATPRAVYHLDASGHVMYPLEPRQRATPANPADEALPVIGGIAPGELQPGRCLNVPQAQAALRLIEAFKESPLAGLVTLKHVEVAAPEVLVVSTGQGSEVTFALTDLKQQLRRWHAIFELGRQTGNTIATLDLAISNNIPLRWFEAAADPSAEPKPVRATHPRKKNV